MDKKFIIFSILLFILIIAIPVIQSLLFTQSTIENGRIEINETIEVPFLNGNEKQAIILFFGYVGCTDVCIPLLNQLKTMYEKPEFKIFHSSTDIVFVNLLPQLEPAQPKLFAETFNSNFKGVYLSQSQLNNIERKFRLFFSKNIFDKNKLNHTDYIYLLERQANGQLILKNLYNTHPFKPYTLINDLS